jgi:hypothetical protein
MPKNSLGADPYYDAMSKGEVNSNGEVTPKGRGYGTGSADIPYADPKGHTVDPDTQKRLKKSMMAADAAKIAARDPDMHTLADKLHPVRK